MISGKCSALGLRRPRRHCCGSGSRQGPRPQHSFLCFVQRSKQTNQKSTDSDEKCCAQSANVREIIVFSRASSSTLKREAPRRGAISMHLGAFSAGNQIFAAGEPLCWCQGRQALECWALGCRVWGRLAGPSAGLCAALGAWLLVAGSGCGLCVWLGAVRAGSGRSAWRLRECGAGPGRVRSDYARPRLAIVRAAVGGVGRSAEAHCR